MAQLCASFMLITIDKSLTEVRPRKGARDYNHILLRCWCNLSWR